MIPSFFKIEIFAMHTKYSGSVTNGLKNTLGNELLGILKNVNPYMIFVLC